jgi:hypothetical protein
VNDVEALKVTIDTMCTTTLARLEDRCATLMRCKPGPERNRLLDETREQIIELQRQFAVLGYREMHQPLPEPPPLELPVEEEAACVAEEPAANQDSGAEDTGAAVWRSHSGLPGRRILAIAGVVLLVLSLSIGLTTNLDLDIDIPAFFLSSPPPPLPPPGPPPLPPPVGHVVLLSGVDPDTFTTATLSASLATQLNLPVTKVSMNINSVAMSLGLSYSGLRLSPLAELVLVSTLKLALELTDDVKLAVSHLGTTRMLLSTSLLSVAVQGVQPDMTSASALVQRVRASALTRELEEALRFDGVSSMSAITPDVQVTLSYIVAVSSVLPESHASAAAVTSALSAAGLRASVTASPDDATLLPPPPPPVVLTAAAAFVQGGGVECWTPPASTGTCPPPPRFVEGRLVTLAVGSVHVMALLSDGSLYGWGNASANQVAAPAALRGVTVSSVAAGAAFSAALTTAGGVVAWGNGLPSVPALPGPAAAIAAGIILGIKPPISLSLVEIASVVHKFELDFNLGWLIRL